MSHTTKACRFNPQNTWQLYPCDKDTGFPLLQPQDFELIEPVPVLYRYRQRVTRAQRAISICHCFAFDYVLEPIWTRPLPALRHVMGYLAACTPDFSLYADWPLALQQWNVYRSRWVGRFWQEAGIRVIPTVNWSDYASFSWCFRGIPQGQIVAVGAPAKSNESAVAAFIVGFDAMLAALEPRYIIVYGKLPMRCDLAIEYPTDVDQLRALPPTARGVRVRQSRAPARA